MTNHILKLQSANGKAEAMIERGELISYRKDKEELIHQKGTPGWRNSDTEMFPIIGPTAANNFVVYTDRGEAIQDQHGLLRELEYKLLNQTENSAIFQKTYQKNTKIINSKYPEKSAEKIVFWPYSFEFKKKYVLSNEALAVQFEIKGEKGMPFMLGYHPAFKLSGNNTETLKVNDKQIRLQEILDVGSIAYPALHANEITLVKKDGYHITLKTQGFDNFMLWTEVPNMLCIEPITAYPYTGNNSFDENLFRRCNQTDNFEVIIMPSR